MTDRGSRNLEFVTHLQKFVANAGLRSALFFEISPNPIDTEIGGGRSTFRDGKHDAIIAIGGGSAMDGGKAICLTANNSVDLWDFEFEKPAPKIDGDNAFPKLITILTTAGTGAETESTGMVTNSKKAMKFCVWHPELKPSLALLDPELTVGLPANMTAWTGVDTLVHAIEVFLVPGFNPHHGLTNAIILPFVLRFNLPGMDDKVRRMAEAMRLPDHSVNGFIASVEKMLDEIAIPKSLSEIGVTVDCAERIAGKALRDLAARTNPRIATLAEVQALTQTAITKAR